MTFPAPTGISLMRLFIFFDFLAALYPEPLQRFANHFRIRFSIFPSSAVGKPEDFTLSETMNVYRTIRHRCIHRQLTFHHQKCLSNTCNIYSSTLRYTFQCKYKLTSYGVKCEYELLESDFLVCASPVYVLRKVRCYYACCNADHCFA